MLTLLDIYGKTHFLPDTSSFLLSEANHMDAQRANTLAELEKRIAFLQQAPDAPASVEFDGKTVHWKDQALYYRDFSYSFRGGGEEKPFFLSRKRLEVIDSLQAHAEEQRRQLSQYPHRMTLQSTQALNRVVLHLTTSKEDIQKQRGPIQWEYQERWRVEPGQAVSVADTFSLEGWELFSIHQELDPKGYQMFFRRPRKQE